MHRNAHTDLRGQQNECVCVAKLHLYLCRAAMNEHIGRVCGSVWTKVCAVL